jgi:hypothetical protein
MMDDLRITHAWGKAIIARLNLAEALDRTGNLKVE